MYKRRENRVKNTFCSVATVLAQLVRRREKRIVEKVSRLCVWVAKKKAAAGWKRRARSSIGQLLFLVFFFLLLITPEWPRRHIKMYINIYGHSRHRPPTTLSLHLCPATRRWGRREWYRTPVFRQLQHYPRPTLIINTILYIYILYINCMYTVYIHIFGRLFIRVPNMAP